MYILIRRVVKQKKCDDKFLLRCYAEWFFQIKEKKKATDFVLWYGYQTFLFLARVGRVTRHGLNG